jgi:hypothetical protein
MTTRASSGIGGWVVTVTTWARGEDVPRVSLVDVAEPDPKDAVDVVRRASGAPATAVAIKTHLATAALALMRVERGQMRMRKNFRRPRDIDQLRQRILDIAQSEDEGQNPTETNGPV